MDHALTLCSICPSSNILSTNSCWIFIFFGDSFLGLHLIGLVEPVSMSCITVSVRPVIGVPDAGKVFTCFANKVAARARWLVVNSVAASSTSIKCGGSAPSSVWNICLPRAYMLDRLDLLHSRDACMCWYYDWVARAICRLLCARIGVVY